MSSTEFLKYLITEELYLLPDSQKLSTKIHDDYNNQQESAPESNEPKTIEVETVKVPLIVKTRITDTSESELLVKIVSSVGFQMDQIALVEPGAEHHFKSNKTIVFGGENTDLYAVKSQENGEEILNCCSLSVLSKSLEDKKSLWATLKSWFEV
ncbi:MAG: hypothetical protein ACO2ZZ_07540 [Cyclobacteriaceae bacterium]